LKEKFIILRILILISFSVFIFFNFLFTVVDISFEKRDFYFYLIFDYAPSLEHRSLLMLSGKTIGQVAEIKPIKEDNKYKIKVKVKVNESYKDFITKQSKYYVVKRKFIGLTYIDTEPDFNSQKLKNGETIYGINSTRYDILGNQIENLMELNGKIAQNTDLNSLLDNFKSISVTVNELEKVIDKNLIKNSQKLLNNLKTLKKTVNILTKNINDFFTIKENVDNLMKVIKENKDELIYKLNLTAENAENLLSDSIILKNYLLKEVVKLEKSIEKIIEKIQSITEKSIAMVDFIKDGFGNIGLLLNDKEIYEYTRIILKIIKQEGYRYLYPSEIKE